MVRIRGLQYTVLPGDRVHAVPILGKSVHVLKCEIEHKAEFLAFVREVECKAAANAGAGCIQGECLPGKEIHTTGNVWHHRHGIEQRRHARRRSQNAAAILCKHARLPGQREQKNDEAPFDHALRKTESTKKYWPTMRTRRRGR